MNKEELKKGLCKNCGKTKKEHKNWKGILYCNSFALDNSKYENSEVGGKKK
jgi:hypothetical protein